MSVPYHPPLAGADASAPGAARPRPTGRRALAAQKVSGLLHGVRGAETGWPGERLRQARPTLSLLCLAVYLFVVHSGRLPIGQEALIAGVVFAVTLPGGVVVPRPLWYMGALAVWALITAPLSPFSAEAFAAAYEFTKICVIAFLTANAVRTRAQLRLLIVIWLALYALFPVRGTLLNFLAGISTFGRYHWNFIFKNPNDLAALSLLPIALCVGLLQVERVFWLRVSAIVGVGMIALVTAVTQSRGGLLALGTFAVLTVLRQRRKGRTMVVVGAAALLVVLAAPEQAWQRLSGLSALADGGERVAQVDTEGSALQRYNIWKVARHIYAEFPVTGVGFGTYELAHGVYSRRVRNLEGNPYGNRDAHSTYLRLLAEVGVPGVALFLAVFVSTWRAARRALPTIRDRYPGMDGVLTAMVAGQVAYLQAGIFGSFAHLPFVYIFTMLLWLTVRLYSAPPVNAPGASPEFAPASHPAPRRIPGRRGGLAYALGWSSGHVDPRR
jgi:O-antigen ligase